VRLGLWEAKRGAAWVVGGAIERGGTQVVVGVHWSCEKRVVEAGKRCCLRWGGGGGGG
jgi:hypothetical protein